MTAGNTWDSQSFRKNPQLIAAGGRPHGKHEKGCGQPLAAKASKEIGTSLLQPQGIESDQICMSLEASLSLEALESNLNLLTPWL